MLCGRAVAALVLLSLTPTAWAQTDCEPYQKLIAAMPTDFASLKGEEVSGGFAATLSLDGGKCEIWSYDNSYRCIEYFDDEAKARATAYNAVAKTQPCFLGWTMGRSTGVETMSPGNRYILARAGYKLLQGDKVALFTISLQRLRRMDRETKR